MKRTEVIEAIGAAMNAHGPFKENADEYPAAIADVMGRAAAAILRSEVNPNVLRAVLEAVIGSEAKWEREHPGCSNNGYLGEFFLMFYGDVADAVAATSDVTLEE